MTLLYIRQYSSFRMRTLVYVPCSVRSIMRMSKCLETPSVGKEVSKDENKGISFQLFQQAGMIKIASAGSFYLLPMLTRSLEKLYKVIDAEMYAVGAQKVSLPCLLPKAIWDTSNRWEVMGSELFKLEDRKDKQYCLAPTHEEAITTVVKHLTVSHRQLPIKLYQISRKFRDEMRPKNGLLRSKEFEMKDLYTFDTDETTAASTYEEITEAYRQIFNRLDLDYCRVEASSGAMGGSQSHEFHLESAVGEDILYRCTECGKMYNQELMMGYDGENDGRCMCVKGESQGNENKKCKFEKITGIEIAHSFVLGTKYSEVFKALYSSVSANYVPYYMGCYGIGVTRLLAAVVEVLAQDNMIRWPKVIAPYQVTLIPTKHVSDTDLMEKLCGEISTNIPGLKHDLILDDRLKINPLIRKKHSEKLGVPYAVILGKRCLEKEPLYEFIDCYNNTTNFVNQSELIQLLGNINACVQL